MSGVQKGIKACAICLAVFIIISIFSTIVSIISTFQGPIKKESFTETFENIKDLELDLGSSNIVLKKGDSFEVIGKEVNSKIKLDQKGSKLIVREKGNWFFKGSAGELIITVPDGMLNSLLIDNGAGTIEVKDINAQVFDLNQGAGKISIENSTFNKVDIDGGAGEINVDDSKLNNLDLDAGVGRVYIYGKIEGRSEIDCGVGEIKLDLYGSIDDYNLIIDKGLGSINIDNQDYKNDVNLGNGNNTIDIDGGVGAIKINFNN